MALSTVCFDLETFNLDANFGIIFCGVIKEEGKEPKVFRFDKIDPKSWKTNRSNDSKLASALAEELSKHPMWVAHNGRRFDIPYLNTRLIHHNYRPLPSPKVLIDPVELARNKLRMSYNSLEQLASLLGCNSKTPVDHQVWSRAAFDGCKESMEYIVQHCIEDIFTLEKVVNRLQDLSSGFNSWGSGR
jgi:uncharacterized protein YprB with RNaseH-like and TPR domain